MSADSVSTRHLVLFRGNVQGVGFRATTHQIAARFEVTGYVRNLPDGSVELVAEGTELELTTFVAEIQQGMDHQISATDVHTLAATNEFKAFRIRY